LIKKNGIDVGTAQDKGIISEKEGEHKGDVFIWGGFAKGGVTNGGKEAKDRRGGRGGSEVSVRNGRISLGAFQWHSSYQKTNQRKDQGAMF